MSNGRRGISVNAIPEKPNLNNLNSLISDIYVRYIALHDDEFESYYQVFDQVLNTIHNSMKEVDRYYNKYSSRVQFAGSHYDKLRINKPDEFDVDIMIGLPLNINIDPKNPKSSDLNIESISSAYVQLRMGEQYINLPNRDPDQWPINQAAYKWKDDRNFLLSSNFANWFKGVVNKALNKHLVNESPTFKVSGVDYIVSKSESGPAMTLYIENKAKRFKLDVDLVPVIKFPESRWPPSNGYRSIPPGCNAPQGMWMVVPKPNKKSPNQQEKNRTWRIAMHDQERGLMSGNYNMKQAIRLMKKLRDAMGMKEIASYYIKTLFFWESLERDAAFWKTTSPTELFKIMVKKLQAALEKGKIPYFWNKNNNLIEGADQGKLKGYARKLSKLIEILDNPNEYKKVAQYLLTSEEFVEYNMKFLHI